MAVGLVNINKPIEEIATIVAGEYGFTVEDLLGRCREDNLIWPRHLAMYMCWEAGHSYRNVCRWFARDQGFLFYAKKNIFKLCTQHPELQKERIRVAKLIGILE
jgi:chromosomal replication initiation ATPase DnaA